jgi:hypothetical protein
MKRYQQRVITEQIELSEKIEKLNSFICTEMFCGLDPAEQARLQLQRLMMKGYSEVLRDRIRAFKKG